MITFPQLAHAGRLGNQLWEIASTFGMASVARTEPRFPAWDYQPYFNVPPEWFTGCMVPGAVEARSLVPHLDERASVYLQDYGLFRHVEHEVRLAFEPSDAATAILSDIWERQFAELERPLISVHVRRGDNVTHPPGYHPLRSMQYFRDALDRHPDGSIIVFSDDYAWCRANFEAETHRDVALFYEGVARPREYVDRYLYDSAPILDWIDIQLMAACDHHILSNSSYAWWGAFLSQDQMPIYPSHWFGSLVKEFTDSSLMFPPHWIELPDATQGGA